MNKILFLIPIFAIIIIGGLTLATPTSDSIVEIQSISSVDVQFVFPDTEEQRLINADLESQGLTLIDGKWYKEDYLIQLRAIEIARLTAEAEGKTFNAPLMLGGFAEVIHRDANNQIKSIQIIHNRVVDQGEDFLIDQVFKEGDAGETADADQIATICVTLEAGFVDTSEAMTATTFDTNDGLTSTNCISDSAVIQSAQTAQIGALTFDAPTHVPNSSVITGIGICQGAASTPFNQCADAQAASSGILFSIINISDVTLESAETVDITYTADFSSSGS